MKPAIPKAASARLRAAMFQSVGQHYVSAPNIWLVTSSRMGRRWVLRSDLHFIYFLYLEFAPGVESFDMAPAAVMTNLNEEQADILFHATYFESGKKTCVVLDRDDVEVPPEAVVELKLRRQQAARLSNGALETRTAASLAQFGVRIRNGLRLLRFISAATETQLIPARAAVNRALRKVGRTSLEQLAQDLPEHPMPVVFAATFQLLQRGRAAIDLDGGPVTLMSRVEALI